jgi:hypothetical protein
MEGLQFVDLGVQLCLDVIVVVEDVFELGDKVVQLTND